MSEIPKEALVKANELFLNCGSPAQVLDARDKVARYIADVSEKAKKARAAFAAVEGFYHRLPSNIEPMQKSASDDLASLILPDPEDDLLKEAREIAKVGGYEEDEGVVQIIARGIEHGRQGRK